MTTGTRGQTHGDKTPTTPARRARGTAVALALAQTREVEAKDADPLPVQLPGEADDGPEVLRAGEAVGEEDPRPGGALNRQIHPGSELVAVGSSKNHAFSGHETGFRMRFTSSAAPAREASAFRGPVVLERQVEGRRIKRIGSEVVEPLEGSPRRVANQVLGGFRGERVG